MWVKVVIKKTTGVFFQFPLWKWSYLKYLTANLHYVYLSFGSWPTTLIFFLVSAFPSFVLVFKPDRKDDVYMIYSKTDKM